VGFVANLPSKYHALTPTTRQLKMSNGNRDAERNFQKSNAQRETISFRFELKDFVFPCIVSRILARAHERSSFLFVGISRGTFFD
jgi:hypothetical protein